MGTKTYSETIGEELTALEVLLSEDTEKLSQALETLELPSDYDVSDGLVDYLNNFCLEVVYWHGTNGAVRTEILRTYGGPRCDILAEDSDWIQINTYTMGEPVDTCRVYTPILASLLQDYATNATNAN